MSRTKPRPLVTRCDGCYRRRLCAGVHMGNAMLGMVFLCACCLQMIAGRIERARVVILHERMRQAK